MSDDGIPRDIDKPAENGLNRASRRRAMPTTLEKIHVPR